jgi:hypothetical protein
LDVALIVRFVDYKTFLTITEDISEEAAAPEAYDAHKVGHFAWNFALEQTAKLRGPIRFGISSDQRPQTPEIENYRVQLSSRPKNSANATNLGWPQLATRGDEDHSSSPIAIALKQVGPLNKAHLLGTGSSAAGLGETANVI